MPKTFLKSRLHSNSQNPIIKPELKITKTKLPPKLRAFKQKLWSGGGFQ